MGMIQWKAKYLKNQIGIINHYNKRRNQYHNRLKKYYNQIKKYYNHLKKYQHLQKDRITL